MAGVGSISHLWQRGTFASNHGLRDTSARRCCSLIAAPTVCRLAGADGAFDIPHAAAVAQPFRWSGSSLNFREATNPKLRMLDWSWVLGVVDKTARV
jgi:hypothetical protein